MTYPKVGLGKWSTVCAVLLPALAFAAPASADGTDDAFIANLAKGGITMLDNDNAIALAQSVCTGLDNNSNAPTLAIGLARRTPMSLKQSSYFVGLSVATYCPQYKDDIDPSVIGQLPLLPPM